MSMTYSVISSSRESDLCQKDVMSNLSHLTITGISFFLAGGFLNLHPYHMKTYGYSPECD